METLAFIPARGGSKRLPGKNIRLFAGKPLIHYSIAFARASGLSRIVVSTDDESTMECAQSLGAEVIIRPDEISGDSATSASAANHCLKTLAGQGYAPDVFVTLQVTNPLRPRSLFEDALSIFNSVNCDSVIGITENKHKLGKLKEGYFLAESYLPGTRAQDLEPLYFENGLIYLSKPELINRGEIFGKKIQTLKCEDLYASGDIDTLFDFELAELIFNKYSHLFNYLHTS